MRHPRHLPLLVATVAALAAAAPAGAAVKPPTTVAWGGKRFTHAEPLAAWLKAHGVRYTEWAARHPPAAAIVEHDLAVASSPTLPRLEVDAPPNGQNTPLAIALLCAALVVVAAASIPTAVAATHFDGRLLPVTEHRPALLGIACAIGAGAVVSLFAG